MKKIENTIKKRYKAIFATILSILILLGIIAKPNGANAKTLSYDSLALRASDYQGSFFYPGDVVDIGDDAFLNVRYYINTGEHTDAELTATPDNFFVNFEAAWNGSENYEDVDNVSLAARCRRSLFPGTGSSCHTLDEGFEDVLPSI